MHSAASLRGNDAAPSQPVSRPGPPLSDEGKIHRTTPLKAKPAPLEIPGNEGEMDFSPAALPEKPGQCIGEDVYLSCGGTTVEELYDLVEMVSVAKPHTKETEAIVIESSSSSSSANASRTPQRPDRWQERARAACAEVGVIGGELEDDIGVRDTCETVVLATLADGMLREAGSTAHSSAAFFTSPNASSQGRRFLKVELDISDDSLDALMRTTEAAKQHRSVSSSSRQVLKREKPGLAGSLSRLLSRCVRGSEGRADSYASSSPPGRKTIDRRSDTASDNTDYARRVLYFVFRAVMRHCAGSDTVGRSSVSWLLAEVARRLRLESADESARLMLLAIANPLFCAAVHTWLLAQLSHDVDRQRLTARSNNEESAGTLVSVSQKEAHACALHLAQEIVSEYKVTYASVTTPPSELMYAVELLSPSFAITPGDSDAALRSSVNSACRTAYADFLHDEPTNSDGHLDGRSHPPPSLGRVAASLVALANDISRDATLFQPCFASRLSLVRASASAYKRMVSETFSADAIRRAVASAAASASGADVDVLDDFEFYRLLSAVRVFDGAVALHLPACARGSVSAAAGNCSSIESLFFETHITQLIDGLYRSWSTRIKKGCDAFIASRNAHDGQNRDDMRTASTVFSVSMHRRAASTLFFGTRFLLKLYDDIGGALRKHRTLMSSSLPACMQLEKAACKALILYAKTLRRHALTVLDAPSRVQGASTAPTNDRNGDALCQGGDAQGGSGCGAWERADGRVCVALNDLYACRRIKKSLTKLAVQNQPNTVHQSDDTEAAGGAPSSGLGDQLRYSSAQIENMHSEVLGGMVSRYAVGMASPMIMSIHETFASAGRVGGGGLRVGSDGLNVNKLDAGSLSFQLQPLLSLFEGVFDDLAGRLNGCTLDKFSFELWDTCCHILCDILTSSNDENDNSSINSMAFEKVSHTVAIVRAIHHFLRVFFESQRHLRTLTPVDGPGEPGAVLHSRRRSYDHSQLDGLLTLFSSSSSSSSVEMR